MSPDERFMRRALELAALGRGWVEPNPMVGAVVVRDGAAIAEGWHQRFGESHAEINALQAAGSAACGGELYVSLEPCCHHGKTPPCTRAIRAAGIRRVIAATVDPFPPVSGSGIAELRGAGITVDVGCLEAEARALNAPFLKLVRTGQPFIHAKWAMSLDGKIATVTGESKWISGEASRRHAHEFRGLVDAIVVGLGTVLADDPMLTARPAGPRTPLRVVLDSQARIPLDRNVVQTARQMPTLIATTAHARPERIDELSSAGCECLVLPARADGRCDITALLAELGRRRLTNLLMEGGAQLLASFLAADAIDAVRIYLAPILLGGSAANGPVAGTGIAHLADACKMSVVEVAKLDDDTFLHARLR